MELPPEILFEIFDYIKEIKALIAISKVCKYFKDIIFTHTREISINLGSSESKQDIEEISRQFENFSGLRIAKVEISYDANLTEKAEFCKKHSTKITHLMLSEITFLNPILNHQNFDNFSLLKIHIQKCDLASCSQTLAEFILSCKHLKHLTISYCDGLDIDALNFIARQLYTTQIENFELFPSYSYFDDASSHENESKFWRIEKLKSFSVRSSTKEIVVMKKNFVRMMLGRMICDNLKKLELNAELNYGDNFVPFLITHFPSLDTLLLGRGVSSMKNQDFVNICNGFKYLKTLEFHFVHPESALELRSLQRNSMLNEITLGMTKDVTIDDLKIIASRLRNLKKVSIVFYNISQPSLRTLKEIKNLFPSLVQFHKTGQKNCLKNNVCVT